MSDARSEYAATRVLKHNADAIKRGLLPIWTVYDHPTDLPEGYAARLSETGEDVRQTGQVMVSPDLEQLREVFRMAGLAKLDRSPEDDPCILETWV